MERTYYIVKQGIQVGPFSKTGVLKMAMDESTFIWTNGMSDWAKVSSQEVLHKYVGVSNTIELIEKHNTLIENIEENFSSSTFYDKLNNERLQISYKGKRLIGYILQGVVFYIVTSFFSDGVIGTVLGFFASAFAGLITYPIWSGNITHRLLSMKVVNISDGSEFKDPLLGFSRELVKSMYIILLFLPVLYIFFNKNNRTLHDIIFKTIVVDR